MSCPASLFSTTAYFPTRIQNGSLYVGWVEYFEVECGAPVTCGFRISGHCQGYGVVLTVRMMRCMFLPVSPLSHSACQCWRVMLNKYLLRRLLGDGIPSVVPLLDRN
ncbi:hypothetical protein AVEN_185047-1 [Araneus ventricosus]|uniref:Uncharacterized protein n=1 Tax=Araneus ventricosus TaxID=182803 RepID=A0A4Y2BR08_ARAVE|nr:hypothetical protein AVEN_185047-1 [Araneus ventricosus]